MSKNMWYRYIKKQGKHILSSENPINKIKLKRVLFEYHCPAGERVLADILTIFLWSDVTLRPRKFILSDAQKKYETIKINTVILHGVILPKTFYNIISKIQRKFLRLRNHPVSQPNAILPQKTKLKYTIDDLQFQFRNGTDSELYFFIFEKQINDLTLHFYLTFSTQHVLQNLLFLRLFGFYNI